MANTKILKRRIKSAKSIAQITKAMEMVAASKMKRAQDQAIQSRPYTTKLTGVISSLMKAMRQFRHPLIRHPASSKILTLFISTNKSLCGGLNTNLFRALVNWSDAKDKNQLEFITAGKKGAEFLARLGFTIAADFSQLGERFTFIDTLPISHQIIDRFTRQEVGQVAIVFADFVSTLVQKPKIVSLLPIDPRALADELSTGSQGETKSNQEIWLPKEYLIEPDPIQILSWLLPYFVELKIYHYLMLAAASEHSARMVAMKNATDNAQEIVSDLTLTFNKARQTQITAEISEVSVASLTISHGQ